MAAQTLFGLALIYFLARGPYRAVHSVNSYDFGSVYGAARCWLHGQNPYDMPDVEKEVKRAGDDPSIMPNTDLPPSVYLPTALPVIAGVAWLPWVQARLLWSLLSVVIFALSLLLLLQQIDLSRSGKWLLAAGILAYSPVSSGLSTGNPSVLACGLVMISVYLTMNRLPLLGAFALGIAHCVKPQISICAVAVFALWGYWKPMLFSFIVPALAAIASVFQASSIVEYRHWLLSLQQSIASSALAGAINDPRPSNHFSYHLVNTGAILAVWISNLRVVDTAVWLMAGTVIFLYLWFRRGVEGDRRPRDLAFFSAVTLTLVYHRYYDAQLLLLAIPFALMNLKSSKPIALTVFVCLLSLEFPLQAIAAESLRSVNDPSSILGFVLLRHQPVAVLAMCLVLIPWQARVKIPR